MDGSRSSCSLAAAAYSTPTTLSKGERKGALGCASTLAESNWLISPILPPSGKEQPIKGEFSIGKGSPDRTIAASGNNCTVNRSIRLHRKWEPHHQEIRGCLYRSMW